MVMRDHFDESAATVLEETAAPEWHPPARREVRIREVENGWFIEGLQVLGPSSRIEAEFVALRERETMAILRKLLFPPRIVQ